MCINASAQREFSFDSVPLRSTRGRSSLPPQVGNQRWAGKIKPSPILDGSHRFDPEALSVCAHHRGCRGTTGFMWLPRALAGPMPPSNTIRAGGPPCKHSSFPVALGGRVACTMLSPSTSPTLQLTHKPEKRSLDVARRPFHHSQNNNWVGRV